MYYFQPDVFDDEAFDNDILSQGISYRVKILNPHRKRDIIVRDMRKFNGRFKSIIEMKVKLLDEFQEHIPPIMTFDVGYFSGRPSAKHWIYTEDDLKMMYKNCNNYDIMLWCDGRSVGSETSKKKKKLDTFVSKREEKEQRVEELSKELQELNSENLDLNEVQYRLWARMISTGIHSSKETPPQVPMITGITPKRKKRVDEERKPLQESIVSTAAAVVKAVNSGSTLIQSPTIHQTVHDPSTPKRKLGIQLGVSPGKAADIRSKSFGQLNVLKQLYDDNVLTPDEFEEQKSVILSNLKKL